MLIEVLDVHGHIGMRYRVNGAGGQCRIGRSIACDVTLDDVHVAAEHALLTLQADGAVLVQDLQTRNGIRVDDILIDPVAGLVIADGELRIGRTRVRVRTSVAPLPPERPFRRDVLRRHRTLLASCGVLLCLAYAAFQQWTLAPEQFVERLLVALLLVVAVLAGWVGAWTLVSRLTVGAWKVRIHLAIASFCIGFWVWGGWLHGLAAFTLQSPWITPLMIPLAAAVAWVAAWLHLRNATLVPRLSSAILAMLAPLLCAGVWWLIDQQLDSRTVNRVATGAAVFPASVRVAPSMDLGDYLSDVAALKREANRNRQESLQEVPVLDAPE